ncbi:hypothetical protein GQ53DRAFT_365423 [Thozetella sp. PMI_491]|nr:hypothetical protein GQ53DRAFT_365423 [Thozetella sp. PMI_491]
MLASNYFLGIVPFFALLSQSCDVGKICAWSYGSVFTISEARPNQTFEGSLFDVSQMFHGSNGKTPKHLYFL